MVSFEQDSDVFLLFNFSCCTDLPSLVLSRCDGGHVAQGGVLQISIEGFEILDFRVFFLGGGVGKFGKHFLGGLIN